MSVGICFMSFYLFIFLPDIDITMTSPPWNCFFRVRACTALNVCFFCMYLFLRLSFCVFFCFWYLTGIE